MNVLIIGAGKVGTTLAGALQGAKDFRVELYDPAVSANDLPNNFLRIHSAVLTDSQIGNTQLFIISVPDDSIPRAVELLHNFNLRGKHVLHTSGFHTSDKLNKLRERGALTAGWHPLQTFHERFLPADVWRGIVCTFEGAPETKTLMAGICKRLGCRQMEINPLQKQALHLAATVSANYSVVLLALAEEILKGSSLSAENIRTALLPLMRQVLENFRSAPAKKILSGPARRGDVQTLQGHLELLGRLSGTEEQNFYLAFVRRIADNFDCDNAQALKQWLGKPGSNGL